MSSDEIIGDKDQNKTYFNFIHCRFLVPGNSTKILQDVWHHFWDKNEDKNEGEKWCHWNYFQIPRSLSELPTNWPGRLSQKSWLGLARWDLKWFQWHHFSPSFLCQNWCQTSWRIFVLFPGTKNLQCIIFQKTKQRVISFFCSDYVSTYLQCRPSMTSWVDPYL